jgi:hypothetical protein
MQRQHLRIAVLTGNLICLLDRFLRLVLLKLFAE